MIRAVAACITQIQLAAMMLTRLPAGRLHAPAPSLAQAAWAFPLVGLVVGLFAALTGMGAAAVGLPAPMAAGLALVVQIMITGALHEDGLADLCDGFWGGQTPARRLEIMRDSAIGSYGTLALIASIGLRWQALIIIAQADIWPVLLSVGAVSRLGPVLLMGLMLPARDDGMGHSARAKLSPRSAIAWVLGMIAGLALPDPTLALACAVIAIAATGALARRKIGGQTGDVLGASQQFSEIALLCAICVSVT
ncbi:cobalamin 5'-phosphate synthase [Thioclava sp. SK-1]|uniref:adenosylcobinamide-GDP ribazoletransferase n=1 Tax=Thioclava sp. SK-1 TaxID=1889770 RepID=UPI000824EE23|nr:adenosylcobinamide-GDP ribazoletransferase [Thioclava sp. SK-1]OCX65974.1 cobalamin 5'-phosphate synthase [Thioclava sp. SK-1]